MSVYLTRQEETLPYLLHTVLINFLGLVGLASKGEHYARIFKNRI